MQLPSKVSHEVYRIAQELTSNIVKGGTATQLSVELMQTADNRYCLSIVDDGRAATDSTDRQHLGLGRHTQQDRIVSIGATANTCQRDGRNCFELEFNA